MAWALWESSRAEALDGGALTVSVTDPGRLASIRASKRDELLRQVLIDVLAVDVRVSPVLARADPHPDTGSASPDDPDADANVDGVDLVIREFGAVPIGEIGES